MLYFEVENADIPTYKHRGTEYNTIVKLFCAKSKSALIDPAAEPIKADLDSSQRASQLKKEAIKELGDAFQCMKSS